MADEAILRIVIQDEGLRTGESAPDGSGPIAPEAGEPRYAEDSASLVVTSARALRLAVDTLTADISRASVTLRQLSTLQRAAPSVAPSAPVTQPSVAASTVPPPAESTQSSAPKARRQKAAPPAVVYNDLSTLAQRAAKARSAASVAEDAAVEASGLDPNLYPEQVAQIRIDAGQAAYSAAGGVSPEELRAALDKAALTDGQRKMLEQATILGQNQKTVGEELGVGKQRSFQIAGEVAKKVGLPDTLTNVLTQREAENRELAKQEQGKVQLDADREPQAKVQYSKIPALDKLMNKLRVKWTQGSNKAKPNKEELDAIAMAMDTLTKSEVPSDNIYAALSALKQKDIAGALAAIPHKASGGLFGEEVSQVEIDSNEGDARFEGTVSPKMLRLLALEAGVKHPMLQQDAEHKASGGDPFTDWHTSDNEVYPLDWNTDNPAWWKSDGDYEIFDDLTYRTLEKITKNKSGRVVSQREMARHKDPEYLKHYAQVHLEREARSQWFDYSDEPSIEEEAERRYGQHKVTGGEFEPGDDPNAFMTPQDFQDAAVRLREYKKPRKSGADRYIKSYRFAKRSIPAALGTPAPDFPNPGDDADAFMTPQDFQDAAVRLRENKKLRESGADRHIKPYGASFEIDSDTELGGGNHYAKGSIPAALGTPAPDFPDPPKYWSPDLMDMYPSAALQAVYKKSGNDVEAARKVAEYVHKFSLAPRNVYKRVLENISNRNEDVDLEKALEATKRATDLAYNYEPEYPEAKHYAKGSSLSTSELNEYVSTIPDSDTWPVTNLRDKILADPSLQKQLAKLIPKGSAKYASGTEALVLKTPQDTVMRIGSIYTREASEYANARKFTGRPNIPEMLQPIASSHVDNVLVEELPFVQDLRRQGRNPYFEPELAAKIEALKASVIAQGFRAIDLTSDNIGLLPNGELTILDPGAIQHHAKGGRVDMTRGGTVPNTGKARSGEDWHPAAIGGRPVWLTDKEFVANSATTARNRRALAMANANPNVTLEAKHMADGGAFVVNAKSSERNRNALAAANANPDVRLIPKHYAGGGLVHGLGRNILRTVKTLGLDQPGPPIPPAGGGQGPPSPGAPPVVGPVAMDILGVVGGPIGAAIGEAAQLIGEAQKAFHEAVIGAVHSVGEFAIALADPDAKPSKLFSGAGDFITSGGEKLSKAVNLAIDPLGAMLGLDLFPPIKMLSGVAGEAAKSLSVLMDAIDATAKRYGEFSPDIAVAEAMVEVKHTMGELRRAQEVGPELAKYIRAQGDLQQSIENIKVKLLTKLLPLVTIIVDRVEQIMSGGELVAGAIAKTADPIIQIVQVLNRLANVQEDAARPRAEDPTELLFQAAGQLQGQGVGVPEL